MVLMGARVNLDTLGFLAVKVPRDPMACKESQDQRETLVLMDRKDPKEILEKMANQVGPETMDHWELKVNGALVEQMGIRANVVMMEHLGQMEIVAREDNLERRESKDPEETEVQEESQGSQAPVESREGRARLALMETQVRPAGLVLLVTEEMKGHLDQRDPKAREESKELQETEARWGRGELMVSREMALQDVQVSRVILDHVETLASRVVRERLDLKEMMETLESQDLITTNQAIQDQKEPKVTEDLMASRDLQGLLDHQELMNVKFWISS